MKEVYFRLKGRVQGVGFRQWTVKEANRIGRLSGWVRNVETGDVEVLVRGPDEEVETLIADCYKGPMFARVDKLEFIGGRLSGFLPPIEEGVFKRV